MDDQNRNHIEAAVFRRLVAHFQHRTDVQNVDLMGSSGFCRNCLSRWYQEAAEAQGIELSKDAAREAVYGMPYADFKARFQTPASDQQLQRMADSVARNEDPG
jgi:hypothetical protein